MVRPAPLAVAWMVLIGVFAAVSLWVLVGALIPSPYSDAWEWVGRLTAYRSDGDLPAYLFEPHNGHLLVWTRGLLIVDQAVAGGRHWLFPLTGAALLAGLSWALVRALNAEGAAIGAMGLAAMLVWFAPNLMNAAVQINAQYVQVTALAGLALLAQNTPGWRGRGLAIGLGALACLGNAAALAVWPALALGALQRRDWRGLLLVLTVGAPVTGLLLAAQLQTFGGESGPPRASLREIGAYVLAYLGLPLTRVSYAGGLVAGLSLGLAGLAAIIMSLRSPARLIRLAGAGAAFSLTTAVLAAVGRAAVDGGDVPLRYASFATPLQLALVCVAAEWTKPLPAPRVRPAWIAAGVGLLALQVLAGHAIVEVAERNRALIADFEAGQRYGSMIPTVHPDLDHAWRVRQEAIAAGALRR